MRFWQDESWGGLVASRGVDDDGSIADVPWASVFDPAANIRALSAVQARGFRAATEVVNRLVQLADTSRPPPAEDNSAQPASAASGVSGVDRVLASWQKLVGQLAQSLRGSSTTVQTGSAMVDFVNTNASGQVALETAEPGAVSTEVWLHNGGPTDMGKIRLRCSDLLSHDGSRIDASMVRFEPDTVPMLARSSRGVTVEVDVADDVRPGCYRGTLLADGHAEVWLPVVLTINDHAT
jgi:hypothetical protein